MDRHHLPPGAPDGFAHHAFGFAPLGGLMFLLFLLAVAGTLFFLVRTGRIATPAWVGTRTPAPELDARKILSERFARGDISSDEFLERASVLNWTPGVEPARPVKKHRRHR